MAAAKIPMHRLFLKIFFWFWLTIWVIVVIVVLAGRLTGMRQVTVTSMYSAVVPILATEAVKAYVSGGAQAFARLAQTNAKGLENQFFLFDAFYLVLHTLSETDATAAHECSHLLHARGVCRKICGFCRDFDSHSWCFSPTPGYPENNVVLIQLHRSLFSLHHPWHYKCSLTSEGESSTASRFFRGLHSAKGKRRITP